MLQVALNGALLSIGKGLLPAAQGGTCSEQKLETDEQLVHTHRKTQFLVANTKNSVKIKMRCRIARLPCPVDPEGFETCAYPSSVSVSGPLRARDVWKALTLTLI